MASPPETLAEVAALLRRWIEAEDASGWAFVRRVPSTHTWKIVDHVQRLPAARRSSLFDAFVSSALFFFDPQRDPKLHPGASDPEFRALCDALPLMGSWAYADVRTLRAWLAVRRAGRAAAASMPPDVVERAQAIRPTHAREIRAAVKRAFAERFGARPENAGGEWCYAGTCRGRAFVVDIDYGGMDQLRYEIAFTDPATGLQARGASYEWLVGAGHGHWDSLTADNLETSIALLGELVERVVTLPDALGGAGGLTP